ncbi:four-helix bundle copper-binding protein [Bosea thiooxidans]
MHHLDAHTATAIDQALFCYKTCHGMAMTHCLEMGGRHAEPAHLRLMAACAEICRTTAHLLLMNSEHGKHLCPECAEVCEACAADCERIGDMEPCVAACRSCAQACQALAH